MDKVVWIDENAGPWKATVRLTPDGDVEIPLPEDLAALVDEHCNVAEIRRAETGELVVEFKKSESLDQSDQT